MKANKIFSIDIEILEKLASEPNQSALVNELLVGHYSLKKLEKMPREKLKELYEAEITLETAQKKVEELKNGK